MPVTSPRRSSLLASGGTTNFTTSTTPQSSITSTGDRSNTTYKSYLDRTNNLSKYSGSTFNSQSSLYYNYSPSNYLGTNSTAHTFSSYSPRTYSTYRSLSGGATGIGTYRNTNTISSSLLNYDTNSSSRCGKQIGISATSSTTTSTSTIATTTIPTTTTTEQWRNNQNNSNTSNSHKYDHDGGLTINDKKPPSGSQIKRTSAAALARFVATSALDIYEKYSPANYKPNTDLSGSRSSVLNEGKISATSTVATNINDTYEGQCSRRSSRYGRWYSQQSTDELDNNSTPISTTSVTATFYPRTESNSSRTRSVGPLSYNTNDYTYNHDNDAVTTATITLRSTRLDKSKKSHENNNNNELNNVVHVSNDINNTQNTNNNLDDKVDLKNSSPILCRYKISNFNSNLNDDKCGGDIQWNYHGRINNSGCNDDNLKIRGNSLLTAATSTTSAATTTSVTSPTTSRYWDRDRDNSVRLSSISHNSNSITAYNNYNNLDDGKKFIKKEENAGLCGLRNIGNTCFMNSVIQCLSHTDELTKFLRSYNAARSPTSKDQQILYEFSKLIKEMWTANVNCVTPLELKRAFSTKHRMYSDYNQQDAQEFLRFFLDSLHSALNTGIKGEHLRIDDNLSDNRKADLTWEWYCRHESSLIRDLFVGQLKSTLRCTTCGNASVTFDPFWDLSVPLPSSSRCKLEACLDLFIREEVLDGDEMPTCSKCQIRRKCTKSFTIQRFPKYLVIHLKRFSETRWSKLSNIVEFPTGVRELNMAPYAANANSNINYSLYAISNHMGSTAGGHYVAICKHPISQKWHEFNDNIVSDALTEHHLVSSSAYILFYERA